MASWFEPSTWTPSASHENGSQPMRIVIVGPIAASDAAPPMKLSAPMPASV